MKYVLGIDLGTSGTKTVLFDQYGTAVCSALVEYPLYQPHNGWAEQKPEDWYHAAVDTIRSVLTKSGVDKKDVVSMGISGQMHGLVMLDEAGNVLRPSIIWCDQRTAAECDQIHEIVGRDQLIAITANPALTGFTLSKLLWVRNHEPEVYAKCRHILLPKDYVRYMLTGDFATEVSDASGMQMLDVPNRCWSEKLLNMLNIDPSLLAKVYESCEVTGHISKAAAELTGLSEDTLVVGGAGDNAAAAVGTGVVEDGRAFTTIGTSRRCVCPHGQARHRPQGACAHVLLRCAGRMARHGRDAGGGAVAEVVPRQLLHGGEGSRRAHGRRPLQPDEQAGGAVPHRREQAAVCPLPDGRTHPAP